MPPASKRWPTFSGTCTEEPPASAISHSPLRSACTAMCVATSEVEQNVCTAMLGPYRSSR